MFAVSSGRVSMSSARSNVNVKSGTHPLVTHPSAKVEILCPSSSATQDLTIKLFLEELCGSSPCPTGYRCYLNSSNATGAECVCDLSYWTAQLPIGSICTRNRQFFFSPTAMAIDACQQRVSHEFDYSGECRGETNLKFEKYISLIANRFTDKCESDSGETLVVCRGDSHCQLDFITHMPTCR